MATFTRTLLVRRFVRAADDATARHKAHHGLTLAARAIDEPYASIASIGIDSVGAAPVDGEPGVWEVEFSVLAQLTSFDALTATEAAARLVTIDPGAANDDVYESEFSVVDDGVSRLPLAG
ncbi:Uncharacterised protein (plasmid) [Tsukamurella tyrosinosolvens]|uniref:Uncharacterized protein n=1 Tax=Tsukamurella tyrosinosolvens TaxID=57704 RepID=A0A1H4VJ55_TSUTY|nr:hypothetical protein [Tsukamurella tyrosinosolvens]KXO90970.1 hypothetical protein AXK58_21295 [Tsukamurella tyrosinosolvens]SEC80618.1 hypothetical protein SAMN04489793_3235 [Tsukamurella tyrosinosolvens]VEH90504.1 Uncharacterised protein [Tsukamurella tyrosinosolvens]